MKLFSVVIGLLLVNGCFANPIEFRWNILPDGDGKMHVIDAKPSEVSIDPRFNPEVDTAFLLFTRLNPTVAQRITWSEESIANSNFNPNWPVRALIHGFNSGPSSGVNLAPTASFLQRDNYNVIVVDWSIGAGTINFITARNRVPLVADVLARFLNFLVSSNFTQWPRINIAGHSLGAHIAGLTGKRVSGRIQVIFGLDSGAPLFSLGAVDDRLAENDAIYTEGFHTNIGGVGFPEPITHAAFYPNWGGLQPGCGTDISGSCSHSRAHELYAESIVSERFVARRCASFAEITNRNCPEGQGTAVMGGDPWSFGLRGIFVLSTNGNTPFAMG